MIPLFKVFMSDEAIREVIETLKSGYIGEGIKVKQFEKQLEKFFRTPVMTTNCATSAEHLILHALKGKSRWYAPLKKGAEILTTPYSCAATVLPILANGFKIRWVDINPDDLNVDLNDLEKKLSPETGAIVLVHFGGYPVDMDRLNEIRIENSHVTKKDAYPIIYDCAHALGAEYKDRYVGENNGDISFFSFQAIKHINSINGGCLVFSDNVLEERIKLLRWYGLDRTSGGLRGQQDIKEYGFKFHLDDVCATVGMENFKHVHDIVGMHRSNAEYYNENLKNISGIELMEYKKDRKSSYWLYPIKVQDRKSFIHYMKMCGIEVGEPHSRLDTKTCVAEFKTPLPNLDSVHDEIVCIPVGWWINEDNREYIVRCIKDGW